jgi:glutamate:GABA antiporter
VADKPSCDSPENLSIAVASDPKRPPRVLGFRDLLLFYVVTGISLRWIATAAAAGPSSILIWIGAWLVFYTPLALCVIELSSRYPNEGGLYVWSKHAFGDFAGFMSAWTYWTCNLPYFPTVLYFAAGNALFIFPRAGMHLSSDARYYIIFSVVGLAVVTVLNIIGLDVGTRLHNLGALAMWLPVGIIIALGLVAWHRFGSANSFAPSALVPSFRVKDVLFWSVLIFAFAGCETASFMGDEIKNPRRSIPLALFTAGVTVVLCYILGTVSILLALPQSEVSNLQGLMQAISRTTQRIGFEGIIPIAAFLIALSNLGAAGPFVAGLDRLLPPIFGALHPRWRTPWFALLIQAVFGVVFAFLGQAGTTVKGAYDVLVSMSVITYFIPFLYLFASMFKLQCEPAGLGVIHVPGGKPVALLMASVGFSTTLLTIVLSLIPAADEPNKILAVVKIVGLTGLVIVVGVLVYWLGKRKCGPGSSSVNAAIGTGVPPGVY